MRGEKLTRILLLHAANRNVLGYFYLNGPYNFGLIGFDGSSLELCFRAVISNIKTEMISETIHSLYLKVISDIQVYVWVWVCVLVYLLLLLLFF